MLKIKDIFTRDTFASLIDMIYGTIATIVDFYKLIIFLYGFMSIIKLFPESNLITRYIPIINNSLITSPSYLGDTFKSGDFTKYALYIFIVIVLIRGVKILLSDFKNEVKIQILTELLAGTISIILSIKNDRTITADSIIMIFFFFFILKFSFRRITKALSLSTNHFGHFINISEPGGKAILVNQEISVKN